MAQPQRPNAEQSANPSKQIYDGLIARGFSPVQAAVLLGNMQQESNFSTGIENPGEGAYGLIQWRLDRRDDLKAFAAQHGTKPNDLNTQLDFIKYEMTQGKERERSRAFLAATDIGTANAALHKYIRYGDNSEGVRLRNAQAIASGTRPAGGGVTGDGTVAGGGAGVAGSGSATGQTPPAPPPPNPWASLGEALAGFSQNLGSGGSSPFADPVDQPAIRSPALDANFALPPNPVPAQYAGGIGGALGSLAIQAQPTPLDPDSITAGAPSMTAMVGTTAPPSLFDNRGGNPLSPNPYRPTARLA